MSLPARALLCILALVLSPRFSSAQSGSYERTFPQAAPAAVQKVLKDLQASTAGRLPVLDGFVPPGNRSLDRFQRGYYQCTVRVNASPSGGTVVQVSAKITAWYNDADAAKSGYQVFPSNGRLESDLLDRLAEALGPAAPSPSASAEVGSTWAKSAKPARSATPAPTLSAPRPQGTIPGEPIAASKSSAPTSAPFKVGAPGSDETESLATRTAIADKHAQELTKEAKSLEEILRGQSHPNNLAAVRKSGTPVVASPNEGAKVLFLAAAEDEFEILDMNASWVHVRISGISRGWILRSSLEVPEKSAPEPEPAETKAPAAAPASSGPPFQVENEEIASFPGNWTPLKGKTVKIVSVQNGAGHSADSGPQAKLQFAKSLFGQEYAELTKTSSTAAGVVVIFDSADGGMVAATLAVLQQWKEGNLSDEALWHRCYFDPPEMFDGTTRQ